MQSSEANFLVHSVFSTSHTFLIDDDLKHAPELLALLKRSNQQVPQELVRIAESSMRAQQNQDGSFDDDEVQRLAELRLANREKQEREQRARKQKEQSQRNGRKGKGGRR